MISRRSRILSGLAALLIAGAVWLVCLHFLFSKPASDFYQPTRISPQARRLAANQLQLLKEPVKRQKALGNMRASNAEWDFMGRTFLAWSLANMAAREPGLQQSYLQAIDDILDQTLRLEEEKGMYFFLMPYAKYGSYRVQPARSLFLDGEIALMLASRCLVQPQPEYQRLLLERINIIIDRFHQSSTLVLESYPDECWVFDHVIALAAIRAADLLQGSDHSELITAWLAMAKDKLVHRQSGLLISSMTTDRTPINGPEGSTIWMVAHVLQVLDSNFAQEQYQRARQELSRSTLGFSYAREWPASWETPADVDSGPIVPLFQISAGSSGMAFIAATAFQDNPFISSLAATLDFAAFPSGKKEQLKYCASNQVGDAALLYAATLGPLWEKIKSKDSSQ